MPRSSPAPRSAPISSSTSVAATAAASSRDRPDCRSTKPPASSDDTPFIPTLAAIRPPRSSTMLKRTALAIAFLGFCTVAAPAAAEKVRYKLDPNHTIVLASWNHFGYSNPVANFGQVDGQLDYDAANPAASGVRVVLPLSGLDSFVPKFDEHLRSADFFDAA